MSKPTFHQWLLLLAGLLIAACIALFVILVASGGHEPGESYAALNQSHEQIETDGDECPLEHCSLKPESK